MEEKKFEVIPSSCIQLSPQLVGLLHLFFEYQNFTSTIILTLPDTHNSPCRRLSQFLAVFQRVLKKWLMKQKSKHKPKKSQKNPKCISTFYAYFGLNFQFSKINLFTELKQKISNYLSSSLNLMA